MLRRFLRLWVGSLAVRIVTLAVLDLTVVALVILFWLKVGELT